MIQKLLNEAKSKDKVNLKGMLHYLKVQEIIHCGECGTERGVYWIYEHGGDKKEGLNTLDDYNSMQRRLEIGYLCRFGYSITSYQGGASM